MSDWEAMIASYERYAVAQLRQPRGIASYVAVLRRLKVYADDAPLTPALVGAYLDQRRVSSATKNFEITVLGRWSKHLQRAGFITDDLMADVTRPRRRKAKPIQASADDVAAVVAWLRRDGGRGRDRRMVGMCLYAGLRISEACGVDWSHVDLTGREVFVCGKGGDMRSVFLAPPLVTILSQVPKANRVGAVAGRRDGKPLTPKSAAHIFERRLVRDVHVRISPHMLRRAFATRMDDQGRSIRVIQESLGHADVKTTERYIGVERRRLRQAMDELDW
jgi:site-specific recombinase XerD